MSSIPPQATGIKTAQLKLFKPPLLDHELNVFNRMWDNGDGEWVCGVISLMRSIDNIILQKIEKYLTETT